MIIFGLRLIERVGTAVQQTFSWFDELVTIWLFNDFDFKTNVFDRLPTKNAGEEKSV